MLIKQYSIATRLGLAPISELLSSANRAKKEKKYNSFLKSIAYPSVLVVDEIGYFNVNKEEANHFFQISSKRYEKSSTILTSNLVFSKGAQVFAGDKIVTTAILDRVLHHSHIINIQEDSFRPKEKKQTGVLHSEIYKFEAKSSNQNSQNQEVVEVSIRNFFTLKTDNF